MSHSKVTYYEVKAELLTPCCISEQPAMGNETETLDYIPGTALRGMLAAAYIGNGGATDKTFHRLFCSDKISFPNLYQQNHYPLPRSAYTCKRLPGFTEDETDELTGETKHGVWDLLFEDATDFDFTPTIKDRRHQPKTCGGPLQPVSGRWYNANVSEMITQKSRSLLMMRTAIHLPTGSALDRSLHTQQELPSGMVLKGNLIAVDETLPGDTRKLADALFERLGDVEGAGITAFTGRRRAGRIQISVQALLGDPPQPHPFVNQKNGERYFIMTFASDVILIDRLLRPIITLDKTGRVLKDEMGFPDVSVKVKKAFVGARRVSGWNAVAQIFKPDDVAMVMGSTFLIKINETDHPAVEEWMKDCLAEGVGLRRAEGFGRVRFDEPFHRAAADNNGGPL